MGALKFAGKKALGLVLCGAGIFFGVVFWIGGAFSPGSQPWSSIIAIVVFLAGVIFGIYFWRSADREV